MVVLEAESADEWADIVSNCFIPLNCMSIESGFRGQMDHLPLGERISVSNVTTHGTTAERSERLARRANADDIHLSLQVTSRGTVRQGRRMVSVRPGSATMYATDLPYYLDYSEPGQRQLIVQVSRSALDVPAAMLGDGLDRITMPVADSTRVFFSYVASLQKASKQTLAEPAAEAASVAKDLASTMIRSVSLGVRAVPRTPRGLLLSIEDFMASNLSRVRVDDVTEEFFISRRTIYNVFEQIETTPSDYLRTKRLTTAATRLSDATAFEFSIADIAAAVGFADATTFTRAFRREFGVLPSEWRTQNADSGRSEQQNTALRAS